MAEAEQVLDRERAAGDVVGQHAVDLGAVDVAVEQHERDPHLRQLLDEGRVERGGDDDQAVDGAAAQLSGEVRAERLVQQHGRVALLQQVAVQHLDDLGIEGVEDVGDDDADRPRAAGGEAAGGRVRHVAQPLGGLGDARERLRRDARIAAQGARDGRLREPDLTGDVTACDGHDSVLKHRRVGAFGDSDTCNAAV